MNFASHLDDKSLYRMQTFICYLSEHIWFAYSLLLQNK